MTKFSDRHATWREAVRFSKGFESLNGFGYFAGRLGTFSQGDRCLRMAGGAFNQTGRIRVKPNSVDRRLTGEFRL